MGTIIGLVITVLVIGGMIFGVGVLFNKVNKTMKLTQYDRSEEVSITNTQDILPFKAIERNRIDLGKQRYVAYVKVEPANYIIRSEEGKDSFAIRLRRAYSSFDFRTIIFTHTRKMVNSSMLKELSKTINETLAVHPDQKDYAEEYFSYLSAINVRDPKTGDLRKVHDYYIVIPWEPSSDEAGMTESELSYRATTDLRRRVTTVIESFKQVGITSEFLSTEGIIELLTSIYRREESNRADQLFQDGYTSILVAGDEDSHNIPTMVRLSSIVEGAREQINISVINNSSVSNAERQDAIRVVEYLAKLERKIREST